MSYYATNPDIGLNVKTDVEGINADMGFVPHIQVLAANAVAASNDGILALTNLSDEAQEITTGITNPAATRNLKIVGNVSGIDGVVTVTGTNYNGDAISEEITANGVTAVEGSKAFKTIASVDLPIQDHTPTAQVETVTVTAGATTAGTLVVTITAAGMTNSPKAINVAVTTDDDTAAEVAAKVRDTLGLDTDVSDFFTVSGTDANIVLTANEIAANDSTMDIALTDADSTGVTFGSSTDTTAGVPYDKISVGWGDKLGLPYKLSHNTVLFTFLNNTKESTAPTVTVSSTALESNTITLNSALNGTAVDVYLIV